MIEESAKVVKLSTDAVWVETQRRSACGQCAAGNSCGTAVLGKVLGNKRNIVRVLNPSNTRVSVGDDVIIGIEEKALVRGSFALYMVPLLSLFLFAALGQVMAKQLLINNVELMSLLSGFFGLFVGFVWVRVFSRSIGNDVGYQPVVLRKVLPLVLQ